MFRKDRSKLMSGLQILAMMVLLLSAITVSVNAETIETCTFDSLGAIPDGDGYVRVGDYFRVQQSKAFMQGIGALSGSETAIYPFDELAQSNTPDPYSVTIKAEGGSVCKTFTFKDFGLSAYNIGGPYNFTAFTITFKDMSGNTIGTPDILGASATAVSQIGVIKLSDIYSSHGAWNVPGVASITIDYVLFGNGSNGPANLQFENITVADVNSSTAAATVTTQAVSSNASTTATGNGNVTSLGSPNPTAHGVCWNTTGTPTIANSKVDNGAKASTGAFTASMTSLTANTTYYVRAYATNTAGTTYGTEVSFTTLPVAPTVATQAASSIASTTATGNGNVTSLGVPNPTAHGVCWNTTGMPTVADSKVDNGAKASTGAFTASMTSLTANTTYYVRAYATNTAETVYGTEVSFTTLGIAPTATTQAVSSIASTTATGNGNVTSLGTTNPTAHGVCWNTTGTPTIADSKVDNGAKASTGAFTASMTSLTANTTYYVRAYATNTAGTAYGTEVSFTTSPIASIVTTQAASSIASTTATGNGNVTSLGVPNPTAHGVCWNTTGTPTVADSKVDNGAKASTGTFTASITSLTANTTYYVRAYATNTAGTVYGTEVSFTTLGIAPTATTQAVSSIASTTATGNGNVTSLGTTNPTAHGVCWNTTGTPTIADSKVDNGAKASTGAFTASMTSLTANTTYYVRAYATNTAGTAYGTEVSFTTSPIPSTVTTQAITSIASTTATGNGNVTSLGVPNPTAHGVCWNTTGTPTVADSKVDNGAKASTGAFTASMTGLSANTTYYVRAYVTNIAGTAYGTEITFTTPALSADATLKAASTVKGQTVTGLGTPNGTLGSETAGTATITAAKAADTSNAGSFITLFDRNEGNATVKAVKYTSGASTANFATDAAYANQAITTNDFFIIKVTAQDTTTVNYYRINVTVTPTPSNNSGGGGGSSTPAQPSPGPVNVVVNGKDQSVGNETKATEDGKTTVTVGVNNKAIESKIDEAIKNNATGTGNVIQVSVTDTKSEVAKVELTGDTVKKLEQSAFDVSIKRDNVEYIISAEEFTISKVAEKLGIQEKDLDDIKVEVKITKLDEKVVKKYNEVAKANGAELVFPPVEFEITAKTIKTNGTTQIQSINKFSNYVERVMEIPAGINPSKITTGIVFNPDGTYSHVPTEVYQKNGKWYARLNSLTNSNYSVVWNPVTVKSVEGHWSKDTVNDMASRLVIFNTDSFDPDKGITRADFAEYIIRALGLYREGSIHGNKYKDVNNAGERTLAILTASEYGIVTGYMDETFRPDQQITREEAMVMYQRAMKITKLEGTDKTRYLSYVDHADVSDWAAKDVNEVLSAHVFNGTGASTISPKEKLTYAEAAQAVKNLLIEAKLINK